MITRRELNPKGLEETEEIKKNLDMLLDRMNKIRKAWGKPMRVTSGLRSQADQMRINPKASKSKHLIGAAVDISDPAPNALQTWCKENVKLLEEAGLWMESFDHTPTWIHFQIFPPKSGKRWFIP